MSNTFSSQILTEKLSKLNNSQQSIETLSHWCIFHRKKAKQIAETWRKLFNSSAEDQKITFLFLANDVLQNSKRKGTEFVNEFWKFLPEDLKNICENGDDRVKNAVKRLVVIWDERKVFGSRGQGLKDAILGKMPPPPENNGKSSNPVKVVRNTHSVRIKLAAGGRLEKIVTAYQSVLDEHSNEDTALDNCKTAVLHVANMEKEVDGACTRGIQPGSPLMSEVQEQEFFLKQSIQQLESVEAKRADLISQLKEALQEQESKNELIQNQLQVAQAETERTISMKQRIISATVISVGQVPIPNPTITNLVAEPALIIEPNPPPLPSSTPPPLPLEPRPIFSTQLPQPLTPSVDSFSKHPPQSLEPVTTFANSTSAPLAQLQQPMIPFANSFGSPPPQPLEPMTSFTNSLSAPPIQLPQQFMPFANSFNSAPPQQPQPLQTPTSFTNSPSSQHPQPSPPRPATSFGHTFTSAAPPPSQPVTSFATSLSAEEQHKKAVAAIAAKLAASTSSAQMLTSALSSLAAEEAASKNGGRSAPGGVSSTPPPKRLKLEKPMSVSDTNNVFFGHMQPQVSLPPPLPQISTTSAPQLPQTNCPPPSFPPPQPPLPPLPPPPRQPYIQTSGAMLGVMPYSFGGNTFSQPPLPLGRPGAPQPPPPPLPPVPPPQQQQQQQQQHQQHSSPPPGFFQPPPQPQQQLQQQQQQSSPPPGFFQPPPQQQQQQQQQQSSPPPGFFQPPGMGFYGQLHSTGPSAGSIDS